MKISDINTTRTERRRRVTRAAAGLLLAVCAAGAFGQTKPAPPKPAVKHSTQIGDATIDGANHYEADDKLGIHITGPKTVIVVPDKTSHSTLTLHADDVRIRKIGKEIVGIIDVKGHVRYEITQKPQPGETAPRVLSGTSEHGSYRRDTSHLTLGGGVAATLTDSARLRGPGKLHSETVDVDMRTSPYQYKLTGDPNNTDIHFTPKEAAPVTGSKSPPPSPSRVVVTGFKTGDFQVGAKAVFDGPQVSIEVTNDVTGSQAHLVAPHVEGAFGPGGTTLARATASGTAHYDLKEPSIAGMPPSTVRGTAESASYVTAISNAQPVKQIVGHGPLEADVFNKGTTAHIVGETGDTLTLTGVAQAGYNYSIDSPNGTEHLMLRPPDPAAAATTPPGKKK